MFITIQSDVMSEVGGPKRQRHPDIAHQCPAASTLSFSQIILIEYSSTLRRHHICLHIVTISSLLFKNCMESPPTYLAAVQWCYTDTAGLLRSSQEKSHRLPADHISCMIVSHTVSHCMCDLTWKIW